MYFYGQKMMAADLMMIPSLSLTPQRFGLDKTAIWSLKSLCFVTEPSKCICSPYTCWNICAEYSPLEPGKNAQLAALGQDPCTCCLELSYSLTVSVYPELESGH